MQWCKQTRTLTTTDVHDHHVGAHTLVTTRTTIHAKSHMWCTCSWVQCVSTRVATWVTERYIHADHVGMGEGGCPLLPVQLELLHCIDTKSASMLKTASSVVVQTATHWEQHTHI